MSNRRNRSSKGNQAKAPAEPKTTQPATEGRDEDISPSHEELPADDGAEAVEEIVASVEASQEAKEADDEPAEAEDADLDGEDSLTFSNGVIEKIVAISMREVPGVIGMKGGWLNRVQDVIGVSDSRKGVTVEVTPDAAVRVNISVLIEYGAYAPQVFEDVKKAVVKNVTGMTGLSVAGVNLRIEDVLTEEEIAARRDAEKRAEASAGAEGQPEASEGE